MPPLSYIQQSLRGALRLARFDAGGFDDLDISESGFWRSFLAAVIIAPLFLYLLLVRVGLGYEEAPLGRFLIMEMIAYVIFWTAFPLLMAHITLALGRRDHYIKFIVAYNWAAVPQNVLYLMISILGMGHAIPIGAANFLSLAALIWILIFSWFIARRALELPAMAASAIVAVDFLLGVCIELTADFLLGT